MPLIFQLRKCEGDNGFTNNKKKYPPMFMVAIKIFTSDKKKTT